MYTVELNTRTASIRSLHEPNIQKLHHVFHNAEGWLLPAGKTVIRRFFLGLIQGIEDTNLIKRLIVLFSSASQKDYVYTRSRSNPGLPSDTTTKSFNKDFSSKVINDCASETLQWYNNADKHCRVTFLLYIAKLCADTGIAHQACNLCKTLLSRRKVELISKQEHNLTEEDETTSIDSSTYTFQTDDHPELYQFPMIIPGYGEIPSSTFPSDEKLLNGLRKKRIGRRSEVIDDKSESDRFSNTGICLISTSYSALSGVSPCCNFITILPVHLSKRILGMLSKSDLSSCALVHSRWRRLVSQVRSDEFALQIIKEEAILMQGVSAKGSNPHYAKIQQVLIPVIDDVTQDVVKKNIHLTVNPRSDVNERLFEATFRGFETEYVDVEERNVYCGAYNLLVLDQRSNANRVISYAGEENLVIGFADKIIRTLDVSSGRDKKPSMQGHPASITALYIGRKDQGSVFSGSYDTTIRKWNMNTGSCQMILHGHRSSVSSLHLSGDLLVSGAQDGLVKIWNTVTGTCICTFKHSRKYAVTCVRINNSTIASSCEKGLVKVWNLKTRKLVKTMNNHGGNKVNCIRFNDYFLLSGGSDGYLLLWSMPGRQSICLKAYRHPKPVLCVELRYMCAITGCADGKIRVINMLSGDCLRVLRGNSQCDPIINIFATQDRLLVNTCSNCLVMHFEPVTWQYNAACGQISVETTNHARILANRPASSTLQHSVSRAKRLSTSASDKRIFNRACSAPATACKKNPSQPVIYVGHGSRPPSHYIDLQPEFRRPRSVPTISVTSVRPFSSASRATAGPGSKLHSRVVSACSRSSQFSKSTVKNESSLNSLAPTDRHYGNKHSTTTRDNLLMRVGMLNHVKKNMNHNINTESNSISYFDRFYPRSEALERPSSPTLFPATLSKFSKISIGNFTTEEEIKDIKSVLKESCPDRDSLQRKYLRAGEPSLDPFRREFTFVKKDVDIAKKKSSGIKVDNFLNRQLGVTITGDV